MQVCSLRLWLHSMESLHKARIWLVDCDINDKMVMGIGQLKLLISFDTLVQISSLICHFIAFSLLILPIYLDQTGTFCGPRRH